MFYTIGVNVDNQTKLVPSIWRVVAIAALCACAVLGVLILSKPAAQSPANQAAGNEASKETQPAANAEDPLSLWTDEAPLKKELVAYVEAVTDESSPDFIPAEDRIATFDIDGTLLNETDPNYFDYTLLVYRVTEDRSTTTCTSLPSPRCPAIRA